MKVRVLRKGTAIFEFFLSLLLNLQNSDFNSSMAFCLTRAMLLFRVLQIVTMTSQSLYFAEAPHIGVMVSRL